MEGEGQNLPLIHCVHIVDATLLQLTSLGYGCIMPLT